MVAAAHLFYLGHVLDYLLDHRVCNLYQSAVRIGGQYPVLYTTLLTTG